MPNTLDIYLYGARVATLAMVRASEYRLTYEDGWVGVPVSMSLPVAERIHKGGAVHSFIDNLLPDNPNVRERWAVAAGLSNTEPFRLLAAYGQDVAGALRFVGPGGPPDSGSALAPVGDAGIADRIRAIRADDSMWNTPEATGRFSLGGAQGKFALAHTDDGWFDPTGDQPSTHIFKPQVRGLEDAELVEYVTMAVADLLDISVANTTIAAFGTERTLVSERFDRFVSLGRVQRIHQEDICQALGVPRLRKYQSDGGPSLRDILGLFDRFDNRDDAESAKQRFVQSMLYSWLVLNTDAHAKNFAVLHLPDRQILAPLYDMSSSLPYVTVPGQGFDNTNLSMRLVDSYRAGDMTRLEWWGAARDARVNADRFLDWARAVAAAVPDLFDAVTDGLDLRYQTDVIRRLRERVRVRAARCGDALADRDLV